MIIDVLLLFLITILGILSALLTGLNFAIPADISNSIEMLIAYTGYFSGIFPIDTLFQAFGIILNAWDLMYLVKLIIWILGFIPTIGHNRFPATNHPLEIK